MVKEKIRQAIEICKEKEVDVWLTFARETTSSPDPTLDLILGTSCTWASAFLITAKGDAIAIVGSLDVQNIKDHAPYSVIGYVDSIKDELIRTLTLNNPQRIAINYSTSDVMADGLSHGMYLILTDYLKDTPFLDRLVSSENIVSALRGRKSTAEIKLIQGAIKETLEIFDKVTAWVHTGLSEQDVAEFIRRHVQARGLDYAWDVAHCPAVFSGPDTAGAHASPTARTIMPGHVMNIDFGVRKNGYVSDLQRTWYFMRRGETDAPEEVKRGFVTIREAIRKAAEFLKPGVLGWQVDAVARNYITDAGYAEFPHGLGHQVGRQAHDGSALLCPRWERYKDLPYSVVEAGQVFTLEPRLTIEGYGIATIEEIVLVTSDGCRFLSTPQEELLLIAP
ncbi:aminopeptidase P family protein [candidate division KSB1 bacterium]|nr:aminopeptidase P family protein [candidate division KSB1 bacterium]RQW06443.1 MAG: aminopeptidase P family protein [candidate division KSB1 bacterium]